MRCLFVGSRFEAGRAFALMTADFGHEPEVLALEGSLLAEHRLELPLETNFGLVPPNRKAALQALTSRIEAGAALVFSAGFRYILPPDVLEMPALFVNSHPHLLPGNEGIDAIRESFARGDTNYGVTVHHMAEEVDAGEIIVKLPVTLVPRDLQLVYDLVFGYIEPTAVCMALTQLRVEGKL